MTPSRVPVAAVRPAGPGSVAIDLEAPAEFEARPGQFLRVALGGDAAFYTISSPPAGETVELTVDVDPEGGLGRRLADLVPGDEVTLAGPYGTACYAGEASVLAITGGPGVGAALAVAERALADGGSAALVYRDDEPIHEARLAALSAAGAPAWVLARDESVGPAVAAALDADRQVFVYGYADFLPLATEALRAAGGEPAAAKVENYG